MPLNRAAVAVIPTDAPPSNINNDRITVLRIIVQYSSSASQCSLLYNTNCSISRTLYLPFYGINMTAITVSSIIISMLGILLNVIVQKILYISIGGCLCITLLSSEQERYNNTGRILLHTRT